MAFTLDEDRRRSQREWVAVPVHIRRGDATVEGVSINVSEGGMYVFAAANFPTGAQVEVTFRPQESETVRFSGMVRRKALYLYAIEFVNEHFDLSASGHVAIPDNSSPISQRS
jgi:PilZ domain